MEANVEISGEETYEVSFTNLATFGVVSPDIKLTSVEGTVILGDTESAGNETALTIDDDGEEITVVASTINLQGNISSTSGSTVLIDTPSDITIGDESEDGNGTKLNILDAEEGINLYATLTSVNGGFTVNSGAESIVLESLAVSIGDISGNGEDTKIILEDESRIIDAYASYSFSITSSDQNLVVDGQNEEITLKSTYLTVSSTDATNVYTDTLTQYNKAGVTASPAVVAGITRSFVNVTHTVTAGATNTVTTNIPVGAKIIGAQYYILSTITVSGGTNFDISYTGIGEDIATGVTPTADTAGATFLDYSASSGIVSGSPETLTLTPDAGTLAEGGSIFFTIWYETLSTPVTA